MQSERPKTYKKGPDVMSKSAEWTQRRHARAMQCQGRQTGFRFKAPAYLVMVVEVQQPAKPPSKSIPVDQPIAQPLSDGPIKMALESPVPGPSRVRLSSIVSDPSSDSEGTTGTELANIDEIEAATQNGNVSEVDINEDSLVPIRSR